MKKFPKILVFLILTVFLCAGSAWATPTAINNKWATDGTGPEFNLIDYESGHVSILDTLYGLDNLARIDDDLDQLWTSADGGSLVMAKFAGHSHSFGYVPEGGVFVPLYTNSLSYNGYITSGWVDFDTGGFDFAFSLKDLSTGSDWFSAQSDNADGLDHMLTWLIEDDDCEDGCLHYVIAWEDLYGPLGNGSDRDFNDLVIEIKGVRPISEPATMLLLGAGFIALAAVGRNRFFKKP